MLPVYQRINCIYAAHNMKLHRTPRIDHAKETMVAKRTQRPSSVTAPENVGTLYGRVVKGARVLHGLQRERFIRRKQMIADHHRLSVTLRKAASA